VSSQRVLRSRTELIRPSRSRPYAFSVGNHPTASIPIYRTILEQDPSKLIEWRGLYRVIVPHLSTQSFIGGRMSPLDYSKLK
jgi:hypothetical protein